MSVEEVGKQKVFCTHYIVHSVYHCTRSVVGAMPNICCMPKIVTFLQQKKTNINLVLSLDSTDRANSFPKT